MIEPIPIHSEQRPNGSVVLTANWLAPRGVCLSDQLLIVADTARNEVHLLDRTATGWRLRNVLGNASQQREQCTASSLHYPSGVWTNGQRLVIADAWNHRVLIWHELPTQDYQPADIVLGQSDGFSAEPNRKGVSACPDANTLYWPYGVWSNGGNDLFIADTGNRRVLYFDRWPSQTGQAADRVIGQTDFQSKDYDPQQIIWPYSVKTSTNGELLISDTQYYRVHYWKDWKRAFQQQADALFGQPDSTTNGQNQFRLKPTSHTLNWCYDAVFHRGRVFIADTGNSRIVGYEKPFETNMAAQHLWGQLHFDDHGEAGLSLKRIEHTDDLLYWPFSISADQYELAVADTGKSRIIIYPLDLSFPI